MQALISYIFGPVNNFVWGPVMLVALLGVGFFLMLGLRFMPFRKLGMAFSLMVKGRVAERGHKGELSPFRALMTALAATIGTGNIAGVATAIFMGGPGAVFWMWCTALLGMATKFSEVTLAVKYREVTADGSYVGGPMYYIKNGLGNNWKWLAFLFALFGCIAGFGIGNTVQVNSIADVANSTFNISKGWSAFILFIFVGLVVLGGVKRIGVVAGSLVPTMAFFYIIAAVICMVVNYDRVPGAFMMIFTNAFNPSALGGGVVGGTIMMAMRFGIARGAFSNEAGMGSSPIAHATAITNNPVRQGIIGMLGTFLDTIVVCSMTAIVILISGLWSMTPTIDADKLAVYSEKYNQSVITADHTLNVDAAVRMLIDGQGEILSKNAEFVRKNLKVYLEQHKTELVSANGLDNIKLAEGLNRAWLDHSQKGTKDESPLIAKVGASLSSASFDLAMPGTNVGKYVVAIALTLFAYTTILGWCVYSERCAVYLFGYKALKVFRVVYTLVVPVGALASLDTVWLMADTFNAMMMIPNLIALALLSPVVFKMAKDYFAIGEHATEISEVVTAATSVEDIKGVDFDRPQDAEDS